MLQVDTLRWWILGNIAWAVVALVAKQLWLRLLSLPASPQTKDLIHVAFAAMCILLQLSLAPLVRELSWMWWDGTPPLLWLWVTMLLSVAPPVFLVLLLSTDSHGQLPSILQSTATSKMAQIAAMFNVGVGALIAVWCLWPVLVAAVSK